MADMAIFLLYSWGLYYIQTIVIINFDLIEVFYTSEKMYNIVHTCTGPALYTVVPKKSCHLMFDLKLWQLLSDFQNSFTN